MAPDPDSGAFHREPQEAACLRGQRAEIDGLTPGFAVRGATQPEVLLAEPLTRMDFRTGVGGSATVELVEGPFSKQRDQLRPLEFAGALVEVQIGRAHV